MWHYVLGHQEPDMNLKRRSPTWRFIITLYVEEISSGAGYRVPESFYRLPRKNYTDAYKKKTKLLNDSTETPSESFFDFKLGTAV